MIQTEPTPNPNSLKFLSEKTISSVGTEEFQKSKINEISNSFIKELLKFKGVFMLSMSKLRDNSKWVLWTLLFFFVASMTVGGLVGGANILGTIQSFFGKVDTTLYVGKIGNESIPISYFLNDRQIQLNRFRQQGRNIDSRAEQNASDFAWNNIIERNKISIKKALLYCYDKDSSELVEINL